MELHLCILCSRRSAHSSHTGPRKNTFEIYREILTRSLSAPLVSSIELGFLPAFPTDFNRVNNDKFQLNPNKPTKTFKWWLEFEVFSSSMLCFQINLNIIMSILWELNQDQHSIFLFVCILLILFAMFCLKIDRMWESQANGQERERKKKSTESMVPFAWATTKAKFIISLP